MTYSTLLLETADHRHRQLVRDAELHRLVRRRRGGRAQRSRAVENGCRSLPC